jgi:hypothetical protein
MKEKSFEERHQQVLLNMKGPDTLSIVSIDGKAEIAIVSPTGVYHDTVTPLSNADDLIDFLHKHVKVL